MSCSSGERGFHVKVCAVSEKFQPTNQVPVHNLIHPKVIEGAPLQRRTLPNGTVALSNSQHALLTIQDLPVGQ
jgi:hypothetical protein